MSGEHVSAYRNPVKAWVFVVAGVYGVAIMVALLLLSDPGFVDGAEIALGLLASLWSLFRLSRCGIYADNDGIRVVNPLSSTRLRWDEVRRFVITDQGPCRIEPVHGGAVKVFGIQHSPLDRLRGLRETKEAALVRELNARLGSASQ